MNGIVRCLKQAFLHFSSSHLLIFDGMVDIVGVTANKDRFLLS